MNCCTFLIKASISSVKERHGFICLPYCLQGKKLQIKIVYSNISLRKLQPNFELLEEKKMSGWGQNTIYLILSNVYLMLKKYVFLLKQKL